jgi:DNA (cytosine-5)-methyltransferase 1
MNKGRRRLNVVSLFSGAGGLDIGFARAGFRIALSIDLDSNCIKTLKANGRRNVWLADISVATAVNPDSILRKARLRAGQVDLVVGGPPCQPFSTTGRRRGLADSHGQLVRHYCRLVAGLSPRAFVFENVPGILNAPMRSVVNLIERELGVDRKLGSRGYEMAVGLINAAAFGVPQLRQRAFIIGWKRPGIFYFPKPTHYLPGERSKTCKRHLHPFGTVGDAFRGLPPAERPSSRARRVAKTIAERNRRWHGV